jgi:hypothetical protein
VLYLSDLDEYRDLRKWEPLPPDKAFTQSRVKQIECVLIVLTSISMFYSVFERRLTDAMDEDTRAIDSTDSTDSLIAREASDMRYRLSKLTA